MGTTITVVAAVITTTTVDSMEDSTTITTTTTAGVSATTACTSVINTTTFMELVKGLITLVGGGVTLQDGITRAVVTYSHLTDIRTTPGLIMPAHIMVS